MTSRDLDTSTKLRRIEISDDGEEKWFKARRYGWGWSPATGEGWFVTLIYVIAVTLIFFDFFRADGEFILQPTTIDSGHIFAFWALTSLLILITWRTGEKPRWRWGKCGGRNRKRT
jgi:hypothetical protein